MRERGATEAEVKETILTGEKLPAKKNRRAYRKNFVYNKLWGGHFYRIKQVMPIVVEEEKIVVITVYVFYF